jgi:tRNA-specific 2-thiouridylase
MNRHRNALVVGTKAELGGDRLSALRVNWVSGEIPADPFRAGVKIRYRARPMPALVKPLPDDRMKVIFDDPLHAITPGQAAVVYDGAVCLGGGVIEHPAHQQI